MKEMKIMLQREAIKWRAQPYEYFESLKGKVHAYSVTEGKTEYEMELHTNKGTTPDEVIVMLEASKKALLGISVGEAQYFAVCKDGTTRDATPDEAF
jgi:hypothetical protein